MCFLSGTCVSLLCDLTFKCLFLGTETLAPQPAPWSTSSNSRPYQLCIMFQACVVVLKLLISKLLNDLGRQGIANPGKSALRVTCCSSRLQARASGPSIWLRLTCFFCEGLQFFTLSSQWVSSLERRNHGRGSKKSYLGDKRGRRLEFAS